MEAALGILYNKRSHLNKSLTFQWKCILILEILTWVLFVKHWTVAYSGVISHMQTLGYLHNPCSQISMSETSHYGMRLPAYSSFLLFCQPRLAGDCNDHVRQSHPPLNSLRYYVAVIQDKHLFSLRLNKKGCLVRHLIHATLRTTITQVT